MKPIYVTGGTGFIGRAVVQSLTSKGHSVRLVGRRPPADATTSFRAVDLLDRDSIDEFVREEQPRVLIHLAWNVTHGSYWNAAENEAWSASSIHLAQSFADNGGERLVMAGTCAEVAPLLKQTLYARAKSEARRAVLDLDGVDAAWVRIFFPVGRGEHPDRLVPSLVRGLARRERFLVKQPSLIRDFCSVDDVGRAFAAAATSRGRGIYEAGSGIGIAIGDVSRTVAGLLDRAWLLDFGPESDPDPLVASTARLMDDLGWRAIVSPRDALTEAVEWWKDRV